MVPAADIKRYHAAAVELADEARRIITPALERGFTVKTKADASLVTDVDQAIERRARELIDRWFPDHGVIGEEYPPTRPDSPFQWIIDPIDGTEEFVHGIPTFGTMLALHHRGVPLVGVIDHAALDLRVNAGFGLGAFRNGQRIRLAQPSTIEVCRWSASSTTPRSTFASTPASGWARSAMASASDSSTRPWTSTPTR